VRPALRAGALLFALLPVRAAEAAPPLPEEDCGAVYWDLTAAFDAGDRVFARVLVTNDGPGEHTAVGLGHWIDPSGAVTEFRNGRRAGRWELEADGRRVRIGSTVLDRSQRALRFEVDNDKRGVKIHLGFGPAFAPPGRPALEGPYAVTVEALAAAATGSAWRRGMAEPRALRGWASLVRTRHAACEHDVSARRLDLHARGPHGSALLVHHDPADGASRAWLGWREDAGPLQATTRLAVEIDATAAADDAHGGYPVPRAVRWAGPDAEGIAVLKSPRLSIDPVDALPRLVQMLYSLRYRPRRIWAAAELELRLKTDTGIAALPLGGAGVASTTYLRPLPERDPRERP